jgi:hypothetical protein
MSWSSAQAHHFHSEQREWPKAEQDLHEAVSLADLELRMAPAARAILLAEYARVLRKNHHGREARSIEERLRSLKRDSTIDAVVDVTELLAKPKPAK